MSSKFGIWLQHERKARRLSLRELGMSPTQISKIENGESSPTLDTLEKIAAALGYSVGDMLIKAGYSESQYMTVVFSNQVSNVILTLQGDV